LKIVLLSHPSQDELIPKKSVGLLSVFNMSANLAGCLTKICKISTNTSGFPKLHLLIEITIYDTTKKNFSSFNGSGMVNSIDFFYQP